MCAKHLHHNVAIVRDVSVLMSAFSSKHHCAKVQPHRAALIYCSCCYTLNMMTHIIVVADQVHWNVSK